PGWSAAHLSDDVPSDNLRAMASAQRRRAGTLLRLVLLPVCLAAGCSGERPCAEQTLFLVLSSDGSTASATTLRVEASTPTRTYHAELPYAGQTSGGVELDCTDGYPTGATTTVTATAYRDGIALARGSTRVTLDAV